MTSTLRRGLGLAGMQGACAPAFIRDDLYRRAGQMPAVDWPFARTRSLRDVIRGIDCGYNCASGRTWTRADGTLGTLAADQPAFIYRNGISLGLNLWEPRTNLLLRSQEFDNAAWVKGDASITPNAITAPDGTLTADHLVENVANAQHFASQTCTTAAGANVCFSAYLKAGARGFARLIVYNDANTANNFFVFINLSTGILTSSGVAGTGAIAGTQVDRMADGWWRVSVVGSVPTTTVYQARVNVALDGTTATYTGDGTSGIYPWGAQLEAAVNPSPYVPTVAATATKNLDFAIVSDVSWFTPGGTAYAEFYFGSQITSSLGTVFSYDDGTTNQRWQLRNGTNPLWTRVRLVTSGDGLDVQSGFDFLSATGLNKIASRIAPGALVGASTNGVGFTASAMTLMPTANRLAFGSGATTDTAMGMTLARFAYFPPGPAFARHDRVTA
jgi:hypothetical protein